MDSIQGRFQLEDSGKLSESCLLLNVYIKFPNIVLWKDSWEIYFVYISLRIEYFHCVPLKVENSTN